MRTLRLWQLKVSSNLGFGIWFKCMVFVFSLLAIALLALFIGWRRIAVSFVIVALLFAVALTVYHGTDTLMINW